MTTPPYCGPPQPTWGPPPAAEPSRVPLIVAFVGIFIAIALGVVALLRPVHTEAAPPREPPQQYSDQQIAEAKKAVCGAYDKTYKAVANAGSQSSDDPKLKFVIAVNTRLATQLSSNYMIDALNKNPATATDLANRVRDMASAWNEIVLAQLAGAQNGDRNLTSMYSKLNSSDTEVAIACK